MRFEAIPDFIIIISSVLIGGYFILEAFKRYRNNRDKKIFYWIIPRILIIIFIFMIYNGAQIISTPKNTTTIFVVDTSLSMEKNKHEIEEFINEQISKKNKHDKYAVLTFGKNSMVQTPLTDKKDDIILNTKPNPYFTNIENGIKGALDIFPKNTNKHIVLTTDGKENDGSVETLAEKLVDKKVNLSVYKINDENKDAQISKIEAPENVSKGGKIPVKLIVDSTYASNGQLHIFMNNVEKVIDEVVVKQGKNEFNYELALSEDKEVVIKGEINLKDDNVSINNTATTKMDIGKEPLILIVGNNNDTYNIISLFKSVGIKYESYLPSSAPQNIQDLERYSEIYMVNVLHGELSSDFEKNLQKCVSSLGTGLVVIGGDKSFALGGYENTEFEKLLPVECKMKGNKKQPNMGLIIAIDCSGSMEDESSGIKKIEIAKEAAIRSIDAVQLEDYVGVVGFSDTIDWVVPFKKASNKEELKLQVGKLASKGGTLILPSIEKCIDTLKNAPVKTKHIILLTDGQGEKDGYKKYEALMKQYGITMSTVAVGNDADKSILQSLSSITGGRSYFTGDYTTLPKIFTKETYTASKRYLNNTTFTPIQTKETDYFKATFLPKLYGYTGTGLKNGGEMVLKSTYDDPILASWDYGLGKVVVWTPDLNGGWSKDFIKWNEFQNIWSKITYWALKNSDSKNIKVEIKKEGSKIHVDVLTLKDIDGQTVYSILKTPNDEQKNNLKDIGNSTYEGEFNIETAGEYIVTIQRKKGDKIIDVSTKTLFLDYSPEYNIDNEISQSKFSNFVNEVYGEFIKNNSNVFENIKIKDSSFINMDYILIPLVILLFIFEVYIKMLRLNK